MYEFADAKVISGVPFTILEDPIRIFRTNSNWWDEKGWETNDSFNKFMTFYLVDETKNPFDKVKTPEGKEVGNLVMMDGDEKKYADYNFFNYRSPVEVVREDGGVEQYRRKWLDAKMRANVKLSKPTALMIWDSEAKKKVKKVTEYVKLDIPMSAWGKILDTLGTIRETKEDPALPISNIENTIVFDNTKAPAEMYSSKSKYSKEELEIEKELTNFKSRRAEFLPPENPFS